MAPDPGDDEDGAEGAARRRGMAKMEEVYGFSVDPSTVPGTYVDLTVDHLFGEVWTRPGLDIRDRRLVTIGVLSALGLTSLLDVQFAAALRRHELTDDQLRELVVHVAHYVGWPLSTGANEAAERAIARRDSEADR